MDIDAEIAQDNAHDEMDRLKAENGELRSLLRSAVRRVEMANADGAPILSAWRTDAEKVLAKLEGK
jgi:hypothetical protein